MHECKVICDSVAAFAADYGDGENYNDDSGDDDNNKKQ